MGMIVPFSRTNDVPDSVDDSDAEDDDRDSGVKQFDIDPDSDGSHGTGDHTIPKTTFDVAYNEEL